MKTHVPLSIPFAVGALGAAHGGDRRRLRPDDDIAHSISKTEIFHSLIDASAALMTDPIDGRSGNKTACSSPSARWIEEQMSGVSHEDISNFFDWYLYTLPFVYKLHVKPNREHRHIVDEYFGLGGEYTQEIESIHERTHEFWANSGVDDDIRVLGAHGSDLADRSGILIPTLEVMFGGSYTSEYSVFDHAAEIQELISRLPGGYDYPLLTFNAFATDAMDETSSPSIIIGDGYFEFQRHSGLASEGPEYALTHEHAHHLQFLLGVPQEDREMYQQKTRRQELMADAFSAYFLAHNSGGDLMTDEIYNIQTIAYSVGDCDTNSVDRHHGTPQQRRCAARWGTSIAEMHDAESLDLFELKERFDAWCERIDDMSNNCQGQAQSDTASAPFMSYRVAKLGTIACGIIAISGF